MRVSGYLLYDGECAFCTSSARWLARHAISATRVEPWQRVDIAALGVTREQVDESVQLVTSEARASGPDAIARYLQSSTATWRLVGRVLMWRPVNAVAWPVYHLVSRYRRRLPGGTPACASDSGREVGRSLAQTPHGRFRPAAIRQRVEVTDEAAAGRHRARRRPVKVRKRRSGDLRGAANLLALVHREGQYPVRYPASPRAWLSDVRQAWVVERDGDVIGHVAIGPPGENRVDELRWKEVTGRPASDLVGVTRLMVHPAYRGQGIGRALLEEATSAIRASGQVPVLDVVSASEDAIAWYDDLGWKALATYPWGEPDEHLHVHYYAAPAVAVPAPR